MKKYILLIIITLFFYPSVGKATSGACSFHGGVNCEAGASVTGCVQCNDDWINSSVYFSDAGECKIKCTYPVLTYCSLEDIEQQRQSTTGSASAIGGRRGLLGSDFYNSQITAINQEYDFKRLACQAQLDLNQFQLNRYNNCVEGQDKKNTQATQDMDSFLQSRLDGLCFEKYGDGSRWTEIFPSRGYADGFGLKCTKSRDTLIEEIFSENFNMVMEGLPEYKDIVNRAFVKELTLLPENSKKTFQQIIEEAYKNKLIKNYENTQTIQKEYTNKLDNLMVYVAKERRLTTKIDTSLSQKLSGKILLQVEDGGEGWYISPVNNKRYFLGRPEDAFNVMRKLGLGISNEDFDNFKGIAPKRLSGRILLKVEDFGKAYYVNPNDFKVHYLGRPSDAFDVMRNLGLGISNNDIRKIDIN